MASKVVKNDDQTVTLEVVVDGDEWKKAKDNEFQKLKNHLILMDSEKDMFLQRWLRN